VSHVVSRPVPPPPQNTTASSHSDLTVFASPLSRAAAAISADVGVRSRAGAVRPGEVQAAPWADRDGGPKDAGRVVASADRPGIKVGVLQTKYLINDALYVTLPKGSVARLGDTYMSYVLGPDLGDFGEVVIPTGILRIEGATGERPLARIVRQFGEIELDQQVTGVPDVAIPTGALSTVAGGARGRVIYVHEQPVLPSIGHYVLISPSAKNGIKIGDEITFIDNSTGMDNETSAPPVVAGVGQVVRVTPYATSVLIVRQTQPTIRDGMPVRLTGTTP
jgi:hypothetical protein